MYSNELYHYGIPGQEWGKRNGPPYPLNAVVSARVRMNAKHDGYDDSDSSHEAQERKLNYSSHPVEKLSELKRLPKNADMLKARYNINHSYDKGTYGSGREYNCPNCATAFDMVERGYDVCARPKPYGSNVENIEDFFKGGKLVAVNPKVLDIDSASKAYKKYSDYDKQIKEVERKKELSKDGTKELKLLDKERKRLQDLKNSAFEEALSVYNKAKQQTEIETIKALTSQGEGSRGIIVIGWHDHIDPSKRTKSYHALNYKIENGDPVFYDAQSRRASKYDGYKETDWLYGVDPREVYIMRTDNIEPSEKVTEAVYSNRRR